MSLALRLLLVLLVPVGLCFAAYSYANVQLRRSEMLDEAAREVRDHGTIVAVAADAFLRDHQLADMAELTEGLSRADRVLGVLIYDAHGVPVQASRSVDRYRGHFSPAASRARASRRPTSFVEGRLFVYAFPIGDPQAGAPRGAAVLLRDLSYVEANLRVAERRIRLAGLAVLVVIALGISLGVRLAVGRPVATLVRAVERVAAGELEADVPARSDELGRLAAAFNGMTASLRKARADLEAQSEANVALERRLQHAQRLALIGQLAASVAHQVGSPLNVILGRARYALSQGGQQPRDARHFREIADGAERISRVIEGLLSQARRVRGPSGPVDLGELARQTLRFVGAECERRGIAAKLDAAEGVVVGGARDELEQVLLNLYVNAIQAQPRGGVLRCGVRAEDEAAVLTVSDAGPGVPREHRERVFEAFFTTKEPSQGTGLGLSICDEIVRRMGGAIVVSDADEGGARFEVRLPRREASGSGGDAFTG